MPKILKFKKGTGLIEVMVAILILAIVIIGGSFFFVYGRRSIDLRKNYRIAVHLAAQKLEELKAGNYNDIEEGETAENISLADLYYIRSVEKEAQAGGYKKVRVTVHWGPQGNEHDVSLATFISP